METFMEPFLVFCSGITREQAIPINIDHTKDRLGILVLIMLGETVISSTIEFRRLAHAEAIHDYVRYYWVLFWALVLVFFYNLLYFCVDPPIELHAFRRDRLRGTMVFLAHKIMCGSILAVGTAVKLTIEAVVQQEELSNFAVNLWSCSVGVSILSLLIQRLLHYYGVFPSGKEPPELIRLMRAWWGVFVIWSVIPFGGLVVVRIYDPIHSIAMYSSFLFSLCLIESTFTHIIQPHHLEEQEVSNITHSMSRQTKPLIDDGPLVEHYNAT
jgi:Bacterial low temperature requirement A protein (LtrA)